MVTCKECFHEKVCKDMLGAMGYEVSDDYKGDADRCDTFINKVDVITVVRCKDCKHYKQLYDITTGVKKPYGVCTRHSNRFTDEEVALDGFCMYGIRRIDDEE